MAMIKSWDEARVEGRVANGANAVLTVFRVVASPCRKLIVSVSWPSEIRPSWNAG